MEFREFITEETVNEGETWDLLKGTFQMVSLFKKEQKVFAKTLSGVSNDATQDEKMEVSIGALKTMLDNVKSGMSKTSLPADQQKEHLETFTNSIITSMEAKLVDNGGNASEIKDKIKTVLK